MKKFIVLFNPEGDFSQATFPELFDFLLSMPVGLRLALSFDGDCESLHAKISSFLGNGDELTVFELCDGRWTYDRLRGGANRHSEMEKFLDH